MATQEAKIRLLCDTLIIAGKGVIAFSAWSLAKVAMLFAFIDEESLRQLVVLEESIPMTALFITMLVILGIDLVVRVYVGLSARSEGLGKKKGPFYLVVAVLAAVVNASSVVISIFGTAATLSPLDTVVSVVIEITAFAALALVVFCSVSLRRLNKASG